jgi:hypothetical protein
MLEKGLGILISRAEKDLSLDKPTSISSPSGNIQQGTHKPFVSHVPLLMHGMFCILIGIFIHMIGVLISISRMLLGIDD